MEKISRYYFKPKSWRMFLGFPLVIYTSLGRLSLTCLYLILGIFPIVGRIFLSLAKGPKMSVDKGKKPNRQNLPIEPIDPAVENALGDIDFYDKLKRARKMTEAEKKKRKRDKLRVRDTYDLPEWIISSVTMIAQSYNVPPSHIAAHLLAAGIRAFLN